MVMLPVRCTPKEHVEIRVWEIPLELSSAILRCQYHRKELDSDPKNFRQQVENLALSYETLGRVLAREISEGRNLEMRVNGQMVMP